MQLEKLDGRRNQADQIQTLVALHRHPAPDAEIADAMLALVQAPAASARLHAPFWVLVASLMRKHGDAATLAALAPLCRAKPDLQLVSDALAAQFELPEVDPNSGDALLAQIYQDPGSDAKRRVYADWLLDRGDPRGEFIALQYRTRPLSVEQRRREKALLAAHWKEWLGPLASAVAKKDLRWRRGFPVAGKFKKSRCAWKGLREHPAWSTFEELAFTYELPDLGRTPLRALRVAMNVGDEELLGLAEAGAPIERLELWGPGYPGTSLDDDPELIEALESLSRLRVLHLATNGLCQMNSIEDLEALWHTELIGRLECLSIHCCCAPMTARWLATIEKRAPAVPALELREKGGEGYDSSGWVLRFTRNARGKLSHLAATYRPRREQGRGSPLSWLPDRLSELSPRKLRTIQVTLHGIDARLSRLRRQLRRFELKELQVERV